jgi:phage terminase large subunit-like protein
VDFVALAIAYAQEAVEDRRGAWTGKLLRRAARRFLDDLKRAQRPQSPYRFSAKWANRVCAFVELLPHVEDSWETETIVLQHFQIFFLVQLFGFRTPTGRRFTEALFAVARKNAKSTLAAAILLACLCLERTEGPQVISAATTGAQARIVWGIAKRMVEKTPDLGGTFDLQCYANAIARAEVGGNFRPINSKASTQDGLNPSTTNLDELHAHKTHDLLNVLRSAAGARGNPLWLYTTTEGYETPGPWPEIRQFAKNVLQGVVKADHFLALIFAVDDGDDDFDPSVVVKANPLLPANPKLQAEIEKQAINAKAMPGALAEFKIKRLNRPASSATGLINLVRWNRCPARRIPIEQLIGFRCWGALDLASTTDMVAWRMLWYLGKEEGFYTSGRYWVPAEAVHQRTERNSVPYAAWVTGRWLTQTEGNTVDQELIQRDVLADCQRFNPLEVAYDPWNAAQAATFLANHGVRMREFRQGASSYHPAMKALEVAYLAGKLNHGGNPVLRWNAANLVARYDANMNMAPDRKRSADKIDGIVSLAMAFGLAAADDSEAFAEFLKQIAGA